MTELTSSTVPLPGEGEDAFRSAFAYAAIGMALVGLDGRWLRVNAAACELLGYTEAELLARTFQDITHPADLRTDLAHVAELLAGTSRSYRMEKRYYHKSGTVVWVLLSVSLVRGPGGEPLHFISQLQDITGMKRTEEALRSTRRRLRAIFDNTFQFITLLDPAGIILEVNQTALRVSGLVPAEIVRRPFWAAPWWRPDPGTEQRVRDAVARAAAGDVVRYEVAVQVAGGMAMTIDFSLSPVRNEMGEVVLLIAEGRDLSERIALEAQLRQAQKMEAVGRLAGGIAHDFNNLLSVIVTESGMLLAQLGADAPAHESAAAINDAAARGAALTRQLLAFSRRQILQPRVLDINTLVAGLSHLLNRTLGEQVQLEIRLGADHGRTRADPGQLEQAILNLAINARDAMPDGGIIRVETADVMGGGVGDGRFRGQEGEAYVAVRVSDAGTGIDPEVLPHIFEPFFTTKEAGRGTGLGLSMVYGFVKQSGGYVDVESEPDAGTTFTLLLPARPMGTATTVGGDDDAIAPPRGTETIMLVEDDAAVRHATRRLLERYGYTVLVAEDAAEALEIWRTSADQVQLVLTDCVMPGMTGWALAARLRALNPDVKLALMSGYTGAHGHRQFELPTDALFIQKPFLAQTFLRLIRDKLDGVLGHDDTVGWEAARN